MIEKLRFTNLNGLFVDMNTDPPNGWPLKSFEVEVDIQGEEVKRMQEPGIWPHRTVLGKMLIHTGGDLVYDTPENYNAERIRALNIMIPAGVIETERRMGTLSLKYYGIEEMIGDCTFDGYPSLPMQALYPSVTEFSITFKVFRPYLTGRASGKLYSI